MPRWVVVIDPADRRWTALSEALARRGQPVTLVPWAEAAARPERVGQLARPGDVLRLDSPGSDPQVWSLLSGSATAPGVWRPGRAWARGLADVMRRVEAAAPGAWLTHPADEVLDLVDKRACRARLAAAGVPVPGAIDAPDDAASLREAVDRAGWKQVFVKPRWGSSGAGVVAWRRAGGRELATGSLRLDGAVPTNHKRLGTVADPAAIDACLAPILADGAVVERWIPKLGARGRVLDLRVVVVAGRVRHRVARLAAGPITNLHLDASRAPADEVLAEVGVDRERAWSTCEAAAAVFPGASCVGVDLGIDVRGRPFVIEVNAWGDHLRGVEHAGQSPADAQVDAVLQGALRRSA